ncbi:SlyX family protein [Kordiimonas aestuarii]|uniref:SlyX family protein n=1 Tax=Kordiimonas aestuarii TaxID=1005925 RepID=UPI0021CFF2D4|nr:SlyX family protein [Kordiimonas aestuarii]
MSEQSDSRISDLEVKFAFQQETIDSLNDIVTKQWALIDRLTRRLDKLQNDMADLEAGRTDAKADPPPPHY